MLLICTGLSLPELLLHSEGCRRYDSVKDRRAYSKPVMAWVPCRFSRQADLLLEQPAVWAADERPSSEGGAASPSVGTTSDQGQLASLVQSFNELETIVVAAESLCRSAVTIATIAIRL